MRKSTVTGIAGLAVTAATVKRARARKPAAPRTARRSAPTPALPLQRTALEALVEGDADLVVAEQDARDEAILQALDALVSR